MALSKQLSSSAINRNYILLLILLWLIGIICDRLWLSWDNSVPAWDQADYLNGAINYFQALESAEFTSSEWWRNFWLLSNKIPPLTYILTSPFLAAFGVSQDAAMGVMALYSAVLLLGVYGLGCSLFTPRVGLWAAALCQIIPGLYYYRLEFLLDYPLTAVVTCSFWLLTLWWLRARDKKKARQGKSWLIIILFGISLALALLVKQTSVIFLLFPLIWIFFISLKQSRWLSLLQLLIGLSAAFPLFFPWYRTNWLLILTAGKRATVDSAIAEGDPALNSLAAWTYYGQILPYLLSWSLLIIALLGLILYWRQQNQRLMPGETKFKFIWLLIFLMGGYLLSSFNVNKDARYILPLLPTLSLIVALGLLSWRGVGKNRLRILTLCLSCLVMLQNIFPLPGAVLAEILSPNVQKYPKIKNDYPHVAVIEEIIQSSPYLQSNLGVLPSTPQLNQHNFTFFGGKFNSQIVARQVGVREKEVLADARSLDWFLLKTGEQGSVPASQSQIIKLIETGKDFILQKAWDLPDQSRLKLYRRQQLSVEVKPCNNSTRQRVSLEQIDIPSSAPAGNPIPVTYHWHGSWEQLQSGIVILTWQKKQVNDKNLTQASFWLQDHAIAFGKLYPPYQQSLNLDDNFQVIEHTAMLPSKEIQPGKYILQATYLNRKTGENYPIKVPPINLTINNEVKPIAAPELDLSSQLRQLAPKLALGISGLEEIFAETARINQYDTNQDYLTQVEKSLTYRLQQTRFIQPLNWRYAIALANVLQQDVINARETLEEIVKLDPNNPYNHAYLAFIHLYDWQPKQAEKVLQRAVVNNPNLSEIKILQAIAYLMQGKLFKAWQTFPQTL